MESKIELAQNINMQLEIDEIVSAPSLVDMASLVMEILAKFPFQTMDSYHIGEIFCKY